MFISLLLECDMAALLYDNEVLQMYYGPISENIERRVPLPLQPNWPFDLDIVLPQPVAWPNKPWINFVNTFKDEFEVDGASAVFSTWRVQEAGLLGGNKLVSYAHMTDERAVRLLGSIPEGKFGLSEEGIKGTGS